MPELGDGFAVRSADTAGASDGVPRRLRLNGEVIVCGHAPALEVEPGTATTIATGGVVPEGAPAGPLAGRGCSNPTTQLSGHANCSLIRRNWHKGREFERMNTQHQ